MHSLFPRQLLRSWRFCAFHKCPYDQVQGWICGIWLYRLWGVTSEQRGIVSYLRRFGDGFGLVRSATWWSDPLGVQFGKLPRDSGSCKVGSEGKHPAMPDWVTVLHVLRRIRKGHQVQVRSLRQYRPYRSSLRTHSADALDGGRDNSSWAGSTALQQVCGSKWGQVDWVHLGGEDQA